PADPEPEEPTPASLSGAVLPGGVPPPELQLQRPRLATMAKDVAQRRWRTAHGGTATRPKTLFMGFLT
ncbi:MAG: hypothetical protein M3O50_20595, partial [Myxococcota bacterium]|nr:hypothetical protein [Myxococcota bacterium]